MLPLSFEASDELVLIAIVVVVGDVTDDGERSLDDVTNRITKNSAYQLFLKTGIDVIVRNYIFKIEPFLASFLVLTSTVLAVS